MSIKRKSEAHLAELQDTMERCPHIEEVHFTAAGDHFFDAHELVIKGKPTGKKYGWLKVNPVLKKVIGERRIFKMEHVANPDALIVESLNRDEVLEYEYNAEAAAEEATKPKRTYKKKDKAVA